MREIYCRLRQDNVFPEEEEEEEEVVEEVEEEDAVVVFSRVSVGIIEQRRSEHRGIRISRLRIMARPSANLGRPSC
jgi:hypothetical protein